MKAKGGNLQTGKTEDKVLRERRKENGDSDKGHG